MFHFFGGNHLLLLFWLCFHRQLRDFLVILVISEIVRIDLTDHVALGLLAILLDELLDLVQDLRKRHFTCLPRIQEGHTWASTPESLLYHLHLTLEASQKLRERLRPRPEFLQLLDFFYGLLVFLEQVLQAHLIVDVLGELFLWPQISLETREARLIDGDEEGPQCVSYQLNGYE